MQMLERTVDTDKTSQITNKTPPLVSIILFCKNSAKTIERSLKSILALDYPNIEYIVQDGVSTDGTLEILNKYAPRFGQKMKLISEPDRGGADAFHRALDRCKGSIIGTCLSDEELLPNAVTFAVNKFQEYPDAGVIHGDLYNTDLEGNILCENPAGEFDLARYLSSKVPMHFAASFFRIDALQKADLFNHDWSDDFEIWCRLSLHVKIVHVPVILAKYAVSPNQLSERPSLMANQIANRASFIDKFLQNGKVSEEVRSQRKYILINFNTWAMQILTMKNLPDEAKKYQKELEKLIRLPTEPDSELDHIIPPEIKEDEFYFLIQELARTERVSTILEIGSSAGGESTEAFVTGLSKNLHDAPRLFCMEVSKPRYAELTRRYADKSFVHCYNTSSTPIKGFPSPEQVEAFYYSTKTALNSYPLERVLGWLTQDIDYVRSAGVDEDGIERIKRENGIDYFDMVLIDGSEFTGKYELDMVYGARIILLDDTNSFKNFHNYKRLFKDPQYSLIAENQDLRNGYAVFKRNSSVFWVNDKVGLPIHFFTIVLNGEPFIRYHIDIFKRLPYNWHWHVVEGVADLKHDTAWSVQGGGEITSDIHDHGLSNDGTTIYLNELMQQYPEQVHIYRKPNGTFWDGKREMVNAPLTNIQEECLLWQIDVDEFWTFEQIKTAYQLFIQNQDRTAAYFDCHYFITPNLVTITPEAYSHNSSVEWLRLWHYRPGMQWFAHEPPQLGVQVNGRWVDVASIKPYTNQETSEKGLVFTHYAYVLEKQLIFKSKYYGYINSVNEWEKLQNTKEYPIYLRDYLSWVKDNAQADLVERRVIGRHVPPVVWDYHQNTLPLPKMEKRTIKIIIDGYIFQLQSGRPLGISRLWLNLIPELAAAMPDAEIIVLRRQGYPTGLKGFTEVEIPAYQMGVAPVLDQDDQILTSICAKLGADVFLSTYYTHAYGVRNILLMYDMIPEILKWNMEEPMWLSKQHAIKNANSFIAISQSTKNDLTRFYNISQDLISVAYCGVSQEFFPTGQDEIKSFIKKYKIQSPYFLMVGNRGVYKNSTSFFQAFISLPEHVNLQIVAIGGEPFLLPQEADFIQNLKLTYIPWLSDEELRVAYSGALALIYPSLYEGFGLPVAEAMACGCPVITSPLSSLPEVGGKAVLYADPDSPQQILVALDEVMNPDTRVHLANDGIRQATNFTWIGMAYTVANVIRKEANIDEKDISEHAILLCDVNKLLNKAKYNEARERLYQELEKTPDKPLLIVTMGNIFLQEGNIESARREFVKATILAPNYAPGHAMLGLVLVYLKRYEEAEIILRKALVLNPSDINTQNLLAGIEQNKQTQFLPPVIQNQAPKGLTPSHNILVSAIVSTYNSEKYIRKCLEDLESQTIADRLEIIVIDSGSKQNERKVVEEFQQRYDNIVYIRTEQRETIYAAWNVGIQMAQGKYLTMANTDDRHHPDAFRRMVEVFESQPEVGVVYFDSAITQTENTTLARGPITGRFRWPAYDRRLLFQVCYIGPQAMWRRSLNEEFGGFDPEFMSAGDYEFWLRISDKTQFSHMSDVLGLYLEIPKSIEHNDPNLSIRESECARQRHWREVDGIRPQTGGSFLERYTAEPAQRTTAHYPLVSVIIPTYNRPAMLAEAIKSVLAQAYQDFEIIVVNDAGKDVSGVIKNFEGKYSIRYETHTQNKGAGAARNTGMKLAQGKYIAFLDDDDKYYPAHLFALVAELENDPNIVAAYTDALQINKEITGSELKILSKGVVFSMDFSPTKLLVGNYIPILCLMFRRDTLEKAGLFDETMSALEDWEWLIRLSLIGRFNHLPFTTAEYSVIKGIKTRNILDQIQLRNFYQQVYSRYSRSTSIEVRDRQAEFYAQITGRDLKTDLPSLFTLPLPMPSQPIATTQMAPIRAVQTFKQLLESEDLLKALKERESDLDNELLNVVIANADTARLDADIDLAEGLDDLAAYIEEHLPVSRNLKRQVLVDIVIPIYGQAELVRECVESVLATTENAHIILVDDCSPGNEIQSLFQGWQDHQRITVSRTPNNQGFIGATRMGAGLGNAPYILFLNSDIKAFASGWLEAMIPNDAKVAIVGAKLLYPPTIIGVLAGKVQHAGVARKTEGVPYHPFWGWATDASEVNIEREVNAVTGACYLVKRKVWDELGGWDPIFGRGVYEDVDFCWQSRQIGYLVQYRPQACLYHYSSASEGVQGKYLLYDKRNENLNKLLLKWRPLESDEEIFFGQEAAKRWRLARKDIIQATRLIGQGKQADAMRLMKKVVKNVPDLPEALVGYAQLLSAAGQHQKAAEYLAKAVKIVPAYWDARLRLVDEWIAADDFEKAAEELIHLQATFPNDLSIQQRAAKLAVYFGIVPQVKSDLIAASTQKPTNIASLKVIQNLDMLLNSDDLPNALKEHESWLDEELLVLVRRNAATALVDGNNDLVDGLEDLASYIANVIAVRQSSIQPIIPSPIERLTKLLDADDLLIALEAHQDWLDNDILVLVQRNAETARGQGEGDLADGLDNLVEYIQQALNKRE